MSYRVKMGDQQVGKETAETKLLGILPPPGMVSHWCQEKNELIKVDIEWTISQFSLLEIFKNWDCISSVTFFHQKSYQKWLLKLSDMGSNLGIQLENVEADEICSPTRVTIAISNKRREKIFPQQSCIPNGI